jgi:hypothetical protein
MPTRRSNDRASSPEMLTFGVTDDTGPQFTLHDGAVTATSPARPKSLPPGGGLANAWERGWQCTSMDGRSYGLGR